MTNEQTREQRIKALRMLEKDHGPDGYPAVKMRDISALLDMLEADGVPFAWYCIEHGDVTDIEYNNQKPKYEGDWKPLYTAPKPAMSWQPIETAPKDGRVLLLGYRNSHGNWRTMRGEWLSQAYIDEYFEDPDMAEPGWFETSVEADGPPNCWGTNPTHWMPLPPAPGTQPAIQERKPLTITADYAWDLARYVYSRSNPHDSPQILLSAMEIKQIIESAHGITENKP